MLRDAWIIFTKEYKNVFKDKRAIFSNYILPLLIMPVLFFGMDFFLGRQMEEAQERVYAVQILNSPGQEFENILDDFILYQNNGTAFDRESLTIEFPQGYQPGNPAQIKIYSDSTSSAFQLAAGQTEAALREYNSRLAQRSLDAAGLTRADIESISVERVDVAPEEAQGSSFLAALLPYLLLIFIFSGSMAMGMNITAGEKEKGSLAIILVNQVSRTSIALGKVFFLIVSALLQATSSAIGIVIALSVAPGVFGGGGGGGVGLLQPLTIISLLLTILTAGGVSAALIVLLGALAKNMKEASGFISPVYILVVMVGVVTMNLDATDNLALFAIPLANLIFMLKAIITSQYTAIQLLITIAVNLAAVSVLVYLTSRLYNSEKILATDS